MNAESCKIQFDFRKFCDPLNMINAVDKAADLGVSARVNRCSNRESEERARDLEQRHVPAAVLHIVHRGHSDRYVPIVDLARVGVEREQHEVEIGVVKWNRGFRKRVDVHVELLEKIGHLEGWWRRRQKRD